MVGRGTVHCANLAAASVVGRPGTNRACSAHCGVREVRTRCVRDQDERGASPACDVETSDPYARRVARTWHPETRGGGGGCARSWAPWRGATRFVCHCDERRDDARSCSSIGTPSHGPGGCRTAADRPRRTRQAWLG